MPTPTPTPPAPRTMGPETDNWPFIPAKFFTKLPAGQRRIPRVVVIHDMEAPEKGDTADAIARYFRDLPDEGQPGYEGKKSAHVTIDAANVVQCVHDNDIANAAPGCNADGLQLELAGYGSQTRDQWLDDYSRAVIDNAANVTAQYCLKYGIRPLRLTNDGLADKSQTGIVSHGQVSEVFKKSDHMDPGPAFPWDVFLDRVAVHYAERRARPA